MSSFACWRSLGVALAVGILALGCGGLSVTARAVTAQKPGLVTAYLEVSDGRERASKLTSDDFSIFEDGRELSREGTKLVLREKEDAVAYHTVVLVDYGDATTPERRAELLDALDVFVPLVRATQSVSVHAFDGSERLRLLGEFSKGKRLPEEPLPFSPTVGPPVERPRAVPAEGKLRPRDPSRNLNGAVVLAEKELSRRLRASGKTLSRGTLVIFSVGPDLAGRVPREEVRSLVRGSPHTVFGISFGGGSDTLGDLAKDGYVDARERSVLSLAFEDVAHRTVEVYDGDYLLSYCSPARSGERMLRIEARAKDAEGTERTGSATATFVAEGFHGACDPKARPRFSKKEPASAGARK